MFWPQLKYLLSNIFMYSISFFQFWRELFDIILYMQVKRKKKHTQNVRIHVQDIS